MNHIRPVIITFLTRFFDDLIPTRAASLAFTTLLSIVPLMIFIFYVLSFFPQLQSAAKSIEQFILQHFIAGSATAISHQLQNFIVNVHVMSWINVTALASVALLLIFNMVDAVNGVWHVKMTGYSALSLILYFFAWLIAPIVFAILLLISSYITSLPLLSHVAHLTFVKRPILFVFPSLIEWLAFTLFHWIMPSCRVQFRYALIAGLITMILFEIAKWGFVQYLHYFPTYQLIYGALATIPIFFLWVFLTWMIIIVGALICHLLH